MLLLRNQVVSDATQEAFSACFGPLERTKVASLRRGHAFLQFSEQYRARAGRSYRRPSRDPGRARQPALAHRQLVQDHAGARLGAVGAHHPADRRRDRVRLDPARLAAPVARAPRAASRLRVARLRPFARQDRSPPPGDLGRADRAAAGALAAALDQSRQRPPGALTRPRTPSRSRAWVNKAAAQALPAGLIEAATQPQFALCTARLAHRRRRDVG